VAQPDPDGFHNGGHGLLYFSAVCFRGGAGDCIWGHWGIVFRLPPFSASARLAPGGRLAGKRNKSGSERGKDEELPPIAIRPHYPT